MVSLKLADYMNGDGSRVDLIFSGESGIYPFSFHPGGFETPAAGGRYSSSVSGDELLFSAVLKDGSGNSFRVDKRYSFEPGSYMLRFDIEITELEGEYPAGSDGYLYSLGFGPQLGPEIDRLERAYKYRYFCVNDAGVKRNLAAPEEEGYLELDAAYSWMGIESRYFTVAVVPSSVSYRPAWDERQTAGLFKRNSFYFQRPAGDRADADDTVCSDSYYVYFGPKDSRFTGMFNNPDDNPFSLSGTGLDLLAGRQGLFPGLPRGSRRF